MGIPLVDLSKTKQRLTNWGFYTHLVIDTPEQEERLRAYLVSVVDDYTRWNTSKGVWKRLTCKGKVVYGLRDDWHISHEKAISAIHGGARVGLHRAGYAHPPGAFYDEPGVLLCFEGD